MSHYFRLQNLKKAFQRRIRHNLKLPNEAKKAPHLKRGAAAERLALDYLQANGCRLLQKNYLTRQGEIDLIILDGSALVFVEVRYRKNQDFGGAIESITAKKQNAIKFAAQQYLLENPKLTFTDCRFDVVLLGGHLSAKQTKDTIDWIKAAFS